VTFLGAADFGGIGTLMPSRAGAMWVMGGSGSGALPTPANSVAASAPGAVGSGAD